MHSVDITQDEHYNILLKQVEKIILHGFPRKTTRQPAGYLPVTGSFHT